MFKDNGKTESWLVKAPAGHANKSVQVTMRADGDTTRNVRGSVLMLGNDRH